MKTIQGTLSARPAFGEPAVLKIGQAVPVKIDTAPRRAGVGSPEIKKRRGGCPTASKKTAHWTPRSSTSKMSVAFGGITPPAPFAP